MLTHIAFDDIMGLHVALQMTRLRRFIWTSETQVRIQSTPFLCHAI